MPIRPLHHAHVPALAGCGALALGAGILSLADRLPLWSGAAAVGVALFATLWTLCDARAASATRQARLSSQRRARQRRRVRSGQRLSTLQTVIDAIEAPVIATDEHGLVRVANASAERFFARREAPLVGQGIEELFTQGDLLRLHESAATGPPVSGRVRLQRPEGIRVFEAAAAPALGRGVGRRGVVMTLRDVTELATAVQLKTDFVANASHELRTPLASIRGAVETLRDGGIEPGPMQERLVQMIASNALRLEELMNDLLDLSRLESPEATIARDAVDAWAMAGRLGTLLDSICAERNIELAFELDPGLKGLRTDRQLLEMILKNLIENATKFANPGTTVRVVGSAVPSKHGPGGVRFEVIDKGRGIPLKDQPRVFERFYQVDPARTGSGRRGTGLGLAIVKHAVRNLEGSVGLESVWQSGTTVWFELPSCLGPTGNGPKKPQRESGAKSTP